MFLQLRNKKGADKLISIYWFAVLFIVAAAVFYMVYIFFGKPYDIRNTEANILSEKIAMCISEGGRLNQNFFSLGLNNLFEICQINIQVEEYKGWKNDQYYANVSISNFDVDTGEIFGEQEKSEGGNINLRGTCVKGKNCVEKQFYVLDGDSESYIIKILSVVRKTEKN